MQRLYQARKRFGLAILNYLVTQIIHPLVVNSGKRDVISKPKQLVAGRTGKEYNQRKAVGSRGIVMPTRYLLDSNICIYIQRQKPVEVLVCFQKHRTGDAAISVIPWGNCDTVPRKASSVQRHCSCWRSLKPLFLYCRYPSMLGKPMEPF